MSLFNDKVAKLLAGHEALLMRKNEPVEEGNGVITRYRYPVLTAAHTPVFWRYDLNEETNPFLMERIGPLLGVSGDLTRRCGSCNQCIRYASHCP